ncbi:MAG: hypothetical protein GC156_03260 [Actinomycetales bacterium]|nr:hypothetical protein [Actinomycetales bacterium]
MASSSGDPARPQGGKKRKESLPPGVRGPRGPQPDANASRGPLYGRPGASPRRLRFEEFSYPMLRRLHAWPRWIIVVLPAILLLVGLILTGPFAWIGGIALLIVWAFIAWLTALSWPALSAGSRAFRLLVVLALLGVVVLKFLGRF